MAANSDAPESAQSYVVLVNDEGQYGLHPTVLPIPAGWRDVGVSGSESECMEYVDGAWTDMRPKSLQVAMKKRPDDRADA